MAKQRYSSRPYLSSADSVIYGQYSDVRGDFQYKLTRDQRTPANADRHFANAHSIAQTDVNSRRCASSEK